MVKFKQDHPYRAYGGHIYDMGASGGASPIDLVVTTPVLASLNAYWYPLQTWSEQQIDDMRAQGEANSGEEMPDLNTTMLVTIPPGRNAQEVANLINALDEVEYVEPILPVVPAQGSSPGDLTANQDYVHAAGGSGSPNPNNSTRFSGTRPANGINADFITGPSPSGGPNFSTKGNAVYPPPPAAPQATARVQVAVIELNANVNHVELVNKINVSPNPPQNSSGFIDPEHGTAVASIINATNKDHAGITGIAQEAALTMVFYDGDTASLNNAFTVAQQAVGQGGIISVSQGASVMYPNYNGDQVTYTTVQLPVTYSYMIYMTIQTIIQSDAGIVILSAGNSGLYIDNYEPTSPSEDPNAPAGFAPFSSAQQIPGLMYVGAGAVLSDAPRARCVFNRLSNGQPNESSNSGTLVKLQGWGEYVESAGSEGYNAPPSSGSAPGSYTNGNDNYAYTAYFNGTSSAAPMVAGAAALLQAATYQLTGSFLTANQIKRKLRKTGVAQQPSTTRNEPVVNAPIGPLPDLSGAIFYGMSQTQQASVAPQPAPDSEATTNPHTYAAYAPIGQEQP